MTECILAGTARAVFGAALCLLASAPLRATEVSVGLLGGARTVPSQDLSLDVPNVGGPTAGLMVDVRNGFFRLRPGLATFQRSYVKTRMAGGQ